MEHKAYLVLPPVCHGGGPSSEQKAAAAAEAQNSLFQTQLAKSMADREAAQFKKIEPFETERMNNGLPYGRDLLDYNGSANSQAYLPARARLMKVMSSMGDLPSGAKIGALTDFENMRARDFDNSIGNILSLNEATKNNAANALTGQQQLANPLGWSSAATQSNSSIMNAPLQSQGVLGPIMGAVGAIGGSAMGAFCPAEGSLILMADGSEKPVEHLRKGDVVAQLGGGAGELTETPVPMEQACVEVVTQDGSKRYVSQSHAYAVSYGGYVEAKDAQGWAVAAQEGKTTICSVTLAGYRRVYAIRGLTQNKTYCSDGIWSLE